MKITYKKFKLQYQFKVLTSRGHIPEKSVYILCIEKDGEIGIGECTIIPNLSVDDVPNYESILKHYCNLFESTKIDLNIITEPSIRFGFECALLDLNTSISGVLFPSKFTQGHDHIKINGLIWMDDLDAMYEQAIQKIKTGFKCLKFKIGGHEFNEECRLLGNIRKHPLGKDLEIRLDANGAFSVNSALDKLKTLSKHNIHSIEQPIKANQWDAMKDLVQKSPIKIALDEELIGINRKNKKHQLLKDIAPNYIILKPSILGGFKACEEWIELCDKMNIKYWVTSALESNIGLNAIAQWAYQLQISIAQGLGTGQIYERNFESGLHLNNQLLSFNPAKSIRVEL